MQAQIVAIEGALRGGVWVVGPQGLVFGRDHSCNVRLRDPLASRRHCRIFHKDGHLEIEDLGARNPALVEGKPTREGIVRIGDSIGIGADLFMVTGPTAAMESATHTFGDDTVSLGQYLALHLPGDHDIRLDRHLTTVEQLARLFEGTARMAVCGGTSALITIACETLREWFKPAQLWIARPAHGQHLSFYAVDPWNSESPSHGLPDALAKAIVQQTAVLLPCSQSGRRCCLVAPLKLNSSSMGSIALRSEDASYYQADLRLLQLFGMVFAAFLESLQLHEQLKRDHERMRMRAGESLEFVGETPEACAAREQTLQAAHSDLNTLLLGETGTGKELLARILHQHSSRSSGPFVVVNCAAIPDELFENEFFGHARGAFTGALHAFEGLFSQADGGALLLDEVGDLSPHNQARILRAIEYGLFRPLGENDERQVDVRVLAATNRNLHEALASGAFREDLYHRLNGFEVNIPPLRERKDDIPLLARHFFELGRGLAHRPLDAIEDETLAYLADEPWPGNVRELRNRILRGITLAEESRLRVADVSISSTVDGGTRPSLPIAIKEAERQCIQRALREHENNVPAAAKALGISRSTLYKKLSDLGIDA